MQVVTCGKYRQASACMSSVLSRRFADDEFECLVGRSAHLSADPGCSKIGSAKPPDPLVALASVRFQKCQSSGRTTAWGRQFQFGWSNCRRTARIGCRRAPPDLERLLWRTSSLRAAVNLWPLYFETGRWRGDSLADRMTGSGRSRRPRTSASVPLTFADRLRPSRATIGSAAPG